jgi:hypothetical protein
VSDDLGYFVDSARGRDDGPGTKAAPFKTVSKAVGAAGEKVRIYVCEGTYPEALHLGATLRLYGGFKCDGWGYDAAVRTRVEPASPGPAVTIKSGVNVTVSDLWLVSRPGSAMQRSSVAMVVQDSQNVRVVRGGITAQDGLSGGAGTLVLYTLPPAIDGKSGGGTFSPKTVPGPTLTCPAGDSTQGGNGGGGTQTTPATAGGPTPVGGLPGKNGTSPAAGAGGPPGVSLALDGENLIPKDGGHGVHGGAGGGGGGGPGGSNTNSGGNTTYYTGATGGTGGCGGAEGSGGQSGGYSVALFAYASTVSVQDTVLVTGAGGAGGAGAAGQTGAVGGKGGNGAGTGGTGASGGAGGGGAGGASVPIVWSKGTAPTVSPGTKLTHAAAAAKGGTGGTAGPDGMVQDVLSLP